MLIIITIISNITVLGGSEYSRCEIELRNRVTQSYVTLRVINLKKFIEIPLSSF